jgi:hypothetical protein
MHSNSPIAYLYVISNEKLSKAIVRTRIKREGNGTGRSDDKHKKSRMRPKAGSVRNLGRE